MRFRVGAVTLVFGMLALSGCLGGGDPAPAAADKAAAKSADDGEPLHVRGTVYQLEPRPAEDRRFGVDRPLVYADVWQMLPKAELTNYNTSRDYFLSMSGQPSLRLYELGLSVQGRVVFGLLVSDDGEFHPDRPTIHFTCSQHGNEPSGSEACLIMIEYFVHGIDEFASRVRNETNIVMLPLANPDGKEHETRGNGDEIDINRDHMDMITIEGRGIHQFYNLYDPEVALDLHEFGGTGTQHPLYPTVPVSTYDYFEVAAPQTFYNNDEPLFVANYEAEQRVIDAVWDEFGILASQHYKSTNFVSSIQRNHYGMHNSISLLFETGGGRGINNIDLRTQQHLIASLEVLQWVLEDPQRLMDLEAAADASAMAAQPGIQGWLAPAQAEDSDKLMEFLGIHNISFTVLEDEQTYRVAHYGNDASSAPSTMTFGNGTVLVDRWQADGRVAWEIFEAVHDNFYDHGPRDWGLDVYRILDS